MATNYPTGPDAPGLQPGIYPTPTAPVPTVPSVPGVYPSGPDAPGLQPGIYPTPTIPPTVFREKVDVAKPTVIPITKDERDRIAAAVARGICPAGMKTHYTPKTYRVTLKSGDVIFVEALNEKGAKQKALDAGHKVAFLTKVVDVPDKTKEKPPLMFATKEVEEKDGLVKLASGEWVDKTFYDALPAASRTKLNQLGVNKYNAWVLEEAEHQVRASGSKYLINAFETGGLEGYNRAVDRYNQVVDDAKWLHMYQLYEPYKEKEWNKESWEWFQKIYDDKLNDPKYMEYILGDEFRKKYAEVMQPAGIPDKEYNLIKDYVSPRGFDSAGAYEAGKESPAHAAQVIATTNKFILATASDETMAKINSGEWKLLPYGQIIETKALEQMPPTYRQLVMNSGLAGFEDYQEKVHDWNKQEHWLWNTIDAIGAQSVRMGHDIKNFALLEFEYLFPDVKEGDSKTWRYLLTPRFYDGVGAVGLAGSLVKTGSGTFTAEEAAAINARNAETRKSLKDTYDASEMAAQEWQASRPYLASVYPEGFIDSVKADPSALKDPLLWGETVANTLPYTVGTGIIVAGAAAGGVGLAVGAPLAFAITLSVEGHDIYKDAIANGASHEQALKLANIYGSISAAIETVGDTVFVGALGVGGGAFAQALGKNTANNVVRGAAVKYGWKNLTTGMIKDFVNQGGQEFFQEVVHNAAIKTVNENQALLENTANAFVSGVIGTAPFVLVPAGGQAFRMARDKVTDVRGAEAGAVTPLDVTPQMQTRILDKVFQPVSGFMVETKQATLEQIPARPARMSVKTYLGQLYGKAARVVYKADKTISVGLIDKKTVIAGETKVNEVALAYTEMYAKVNEYAHVQLKLKQAYQAIADFGMAKSKAQLKTLEEYKKRAAELETQLKELERPMVESVRHFGDVFLKNSVGLEAQQKAEIKDMAKTIVADIDSVTTQLFGERNAVLIAKDIKELDGQIKVIEEEMAKGMTKEQLEGYARLINILQGQVRDLVNEMRLRYLAEGEKVKPETKKLAVEVMSLQTRLVKAVENLQNFQGSVLDYNVYRKGELAAKGEVLKLERDTFEAIQKTTEAMWGKEHYAEQLEQLNAALTDLIAAMKEANLPTARVVGIGFNIHQLLRERRKLQALKKQLRALKNEAGKVKDAALRQEATTKAQVVENVAEQLSRKPVSELRYDKATGTYKLEYTDADFDAARNEMIQREAERVVEKRFAELMKHTPEYIQKRGGEQLMSYLREIYDAQYFQEVHEGIFTDLDDYLSVEKEAERIRAQNAHQEWLQKMDQQIASMEAEAQLAKGLHDAETGSKRRASLDRVGDKAKKDADDLKQQLKEKQKTRIAVAEREATLTAAEQKKLEEAREKVIQERLERIKERLASEEKAKRLVETAKEEIAKEEAKVKEEVETKPETETKEEAEAKPDALSKIIEQVKTRYKEEVRPEEQVFTDAALATATKTAVQAQAKTKASPETRTLTATQVQTRVQPAVQAAVKTALQTATKTATQVQVKIATEIVTETVTKTKTKTGIPIRVLPIIRPPKMKPPPFKKEKRLREAPALVTWRQGLYWVTIVPPFRATGTKPDVIYSRHKPAQAKRVATGKGSPGKTLYTYGKLPAKIRLPMGVVSAKVKHGRKLVFARQRVNGGRKRVTH